MGCSFKEGITITNAFQKALNESGREANIPRRKPNEMWWDKESEFYNRSRSMKSWFTSISKKCISIN